VANSSSSTGVAWAGPAFVAGKNRIINGDFGVWQRGTSFSNSTDNTYTADRFTYYSNGSNTRTISQQSFTPGTAPVAGYEANYFFRYNQATAGSGAGYNTIVQRVEDVRTFAGQTATLSMWLKADTARTVNFSINRNYGSGGSGMDYSVVTDATINVTTSWARYTWTFSMPSVSGKTIGAGSFVEVALRFPLNTTQTIDSWGWQLEAGSIATAFQTATGTLQGELAAAQRYYVQFGGDNVYQRLSTGSWSATTNFANMVTLPVSMRVAPSTLTYGTLTTYDGSSFFAISSMTIDASSKNTVQLNAITATATQYRFGQLLTNNSTSGYLGLSAEL
jgi:hypothetical protein